MKTLFTKRGNTLIAEDRDSQDVLARIADGNTVSASITVPRSLRQHRLYWGMIQLTLSAQNEPVMFPTAQHLHDAIKVSLGYVTTLYNIEGKIIGVKPDSTNFSSMDRLAFTDFMNKAIDLIITKVLPLVNRDDFERNLYNMLGERGPE